VSTVDVASLLYAGETVETELSLGPNRLVATSHRLVAVTPEAPGPNVTTVDRPNVETLRVTVDLDLALLRPAVQALVVGVVLVAVGVSFEFGGLLAPPELDAGVAGQVGVGGVLTLLGTVAELLALLDDALLAAGGFSLLLGAALAGYVGHTRERVVRTHVAGEDPFDVPAHGIDPAAVERFQGTLRTTSGAAPADSQPR
jgi:hypothetical protein